MIVAVISRFIIYRVLSENDYLEEAGVGTLITSVAQLSFQ